MNVLLKAKLQLAKMLDLEFASIATDKGPLQYDGELAEGTEVFFTDKEGSLAIPDDGNYIAGGQTITVENGIVTAVSEGEGSGLKKPASMKGGKRQKMNGEYVDVETFNELAATVQTLLDEITKIKEENGNFKKALKMSVDRPASFISDGRGQAKMTDEERFFTGWRE